MTTQFYQLPKTPKDSKHGSVKDAQQHHDLISITTKEQVTHVNMA